MIVQDSQQLEMNSAFEIATVALFLAVLAVDAKSSLSQAPVPFLIITHIQNGQSCRLRS